MPPRTTAPLLITAIAATAAAGTYFSAYLLTTWLGVETPLTWRTWYAYYQSIDLPQFQPYAWKIKAAGAVGFGLPLLASFGLAILALKPRKASLHGKARFATRTDIRRAGLLSTKGNGIVVGKFGGKLIRLPGQQFVILAAPTRSGKGVGVVIPNLLEYQESVVVLDIKQENFNLTSGWRASQGQEVYLFNPFAEDRRTHRWNPLSYISPDPSFRISDIQAIAAMLYPDGSDAAKFWVSQARNAFTAFTLYLFEAFDEELRIGIPRHQLRFPTLGEVYRLSTGDGSDLRVYLAGLTQRAYLSSHAKAAFANLLSQAEETFSSILGSFKEPLNAWINPVLDEATSHNDFLLTDVRKRKMTIYIGIQPNKLAESRLIINLFFSQLINVNTKELPQNKPALKHQCLLLMDEFTSIGKVDILASAVSYMAGYNLRLLPIIQSMAQLDAVYGKDISRTIITNHALQIIYAPREQQDANDYSEMLGYTTVAQKSVTRGHGVSVSRSDERRALMLPQELKAMGTDKEVVLYEGIPHPVMCGKIRYYEDRRFTSRLMPKVGVPLLELEERMKGKAIASVAASVGLALSSAAMGQASVPPRDRNVAEAGASPPAAPMAVQAVERLYAFLGSLHSRSDLTPEQIERAFGTRLASDGTDVLRFLSADMGQGWIYAIHYFPETLSTGRGFRFMFFNRDESAKPGIACAMDIRDVMTKLEAFGYVGTPDYGEIGQVHGWDFDRAGVRITIAARAVVAAQARRCLMSLKVIL